MLFRSGGGDGGTIKLTYLGKLSSYFYSEGSHIIISGGIGGAGGPDTSDDECPGGDGKPGQNGFKGTFTQSRLCKLDKVDIITSSCTDPAKNL